MSKIFGNLEKEEEVKLMDAVSFLAQGFEALHEFLTMYTHSSNRPPVEEVATKKHRLPKDPNAPKHPLSGYLLFTRDQRLELKHQDPPLSPKTTLREIGLRWKALDADQKKEYLLEAETLKSEYEVELAIYKAGLEAGSKPAADIQYSSGSDESDSDVSSPAPEMKEPEPPKPPVKKRKLDDKAAPLKSAGKLVAEAAKAKDVVVALAKPKLGQSKLLSASLSSGISSQQASKKSVETPAKKQTELLSQENSVKKKQTELLSQDNSVKKKQTELLSQDNSVKKKHSELLSQDQSAKKHSENKPSTAPVNILDQLQKGHEKKKKSKKSKEGKE